MADALVVGTFDGVFDGGGGTLVVLSPNPFPPAIVGGVVVNVRTIVGTYYDVNASVSALTSLSGNVSAVSPSTGRDSPVR